MKTENKIDRRQWLKISLGATLGGISTKIFGRESTSGECRTTKYQTMGPFHPNKDQSDKDFDLTLFNGSSQRAEGEVIYVRGKVTDENCDPIKGTVVMIWQANKYGKYTHEYDTHEAKDDPNFQGWGQVVTNDKGEYGFKTIKPAAYPVTLENNDWRTPHIHFKVSKRGYHELITQMYFDGEELNEKDRKRDRLILTITKENGILFAEMPIQPKSEIFPKSKDRYVYLAFEADIEFQRNSENAVIGLIFHRHYEFPKLSAEKVI